MAILPAFLLPRAAYTLDIDDPARYPQIKRAEYSLQKSDPYDVIWKVSRSSVNFVMTCATPERSKDIAGLHAYPCDTGHAQMAQDRRLRVEIAHAWESYLALLHSGPFAQVHDICP